MGAVADLLTGWLPADVPVELLVGWAIWVLGGLLLMLWFTRQSAATRHRGTAPYGPPTGAARLSGTHAIARPSSSATHAIARPASGTHAAARKSSGRHATAPARQVTYGAPTEPPPRASSGVRPPSAARIPDAYSELSLLLDSTDDPPQSNH